MSGLDPQTNPTYCGYCKCDPCQCDGHGNFGPEENVGWAEVHLPTQFDAIVPSSEDKYETEFTYEDGTPVPGYHGRRLRRWEK